MVLQGHVANKNHHISITRVSIATKLGRMIASLVGLLPIMSHDPLITWHWEIQGSLTGGGSACKRLSRQQLHVIYDWHLLIPRDIFMAKKSNAKDAAKSVSYNE